MVCCSWTARPLEWGSYLWNVSNYQSVTQCCILQDLHSQKQCHENLRFYTIAVAVNNWLNNFWKESLQHSWRTVVLSPFFTHSALKLFHTHVCMLVHGWLGLYFLYIPKYSFIPLACEECGDSLPFSGASSVLLCYVLFPATLLHQLFFHPLTPHLAICFLVYLSVLFFQNSYTIPFWEFYFLPFFSHSKI